MSSQMIGIGVDYVATPRPAACRFWLHHSAMTWMYNAGPSRGGTTCRPSDPACTSTFSMIMVHVGGGDNELAFQ